MKKIVFLLVALLVTVAASAQFEKGKKFMGASLQNLDLSYNGLRKGHFGLDVKGGYMFADNLLGYAQVACDKQKDSPFTLSAGLGGRYYIEQNGLYLGASVVYKRRQKSNNDVMPGVQVGYAFFLGRTVTVEPELYYEQSFKNHKDYSTVGVRIGIGIYLFNDQLKIKR